MPWPGSCPSPEWGMGAQDPRYFALSLEVPSSIPGLVCLELALHFSCTPAAPPAPPGGTQPCMMPLPGSLGLGTGSAGAFQYCPLPSNHPCALGSPQLQGCHEGVPSSTAATTSGCFACRQPKVEWKRVSACFGSQSSVRLPT